MNHEPYKLFCGKSFYPLGGYGNFIGSFKSIDDVKLYVENRWIEDLFKWGEIVFDDEIMLIGICSGEKWIWNHLIPSE